MFQDPPFSTYHDPEIARMGTTTTYTRTVTTHAATAIAHTHPLEPTTTAHEKMVEPFFCRPFSRRTEECFSDPTLGVRNSCANHVKM